jgi:hypothetical protein
VHQSEFAKKSFFSQSGQKARPGKMWKLGQTPAKTHPACGFALVQSGALSRKRQIHPARNLP